ncbi:IS110 family transposase, partial [Staphylococcus epidermidis]
LAFSAPIDLENISSETLAQYLAELSRNRIKAEKADQLKQAASNSFGVKFAQEAFTFQLRSMIEQLKFIESQIKETEREIKHIMDTLNSVIL